jgi:hypothetical protein
MLYRTRKVIPSKRRRLRWSPEASPRPTKKLRIHASRITIPGFDRKPGSTTRKSVEVIANLRPKEAQKVTANLPPKQAVKARTKPGSKLVPSRSRKVIASRPVTALSAPASRVKQPQVHPLPENRQVQVETRDLQQEIRRLVTPSTASSTSVPNSQPEVGKVAKVNKLPAASASSVPAQTFNFHGLDSLSQLPSAPKTDINTLTSEITNQLSLTPAPSTKEPSTQEEMGAESSRPKKERTSSSSTKKSDHGKKAGGKGSASPVNNSSARPTSQFSARDSLSQVLSRDEKENMDAGPSRLPKSSSSTTNAEPEDGVHSETIRPATDSSARTPLQFSDQHSLSSTTFSSITSDKNKLDMGAETSHPLVPFLNPSSSSTSHTKTELEGGTFPTVNNRRSPYDNLDDEWISEDENDEETKKVRKYFDEMASRAKNQMGLQSNLSPKITTTTKKYPSYKAEATEISLGADDRIATIRSKYRAATGKTDEEFQNEYKAFRDSRLGFSALGLTTTKEHQTSLLPTSFSMQNPVPPIPSKNIDRESSDLGPLPSLPPTQMLPPLPSSKVKKEVPIPSVASALNAQKVKANSSPPASFPILTKSSILFPKPHIPSHLSQSSSSPSNYSNPYSSSSPFQTLAVARFGEETSGENDLKQNKASSTSKPFEVPHALGIDFAQKVVIGDSEVRAKLIAILKAERTKEHKEINEEYQVWKKQGKEDEFLQSFAKMIKDEIAARMKLESNSSPQAKPPSVSKLSESDHEFTKDDVQKVMEESTLQTGRKDTLQAQQDKELEEELLEGNQNTFLQRFAQYVREDMVARAKLENKDPQQAEPHSISEISEIDHEFIKDIAHKVIGDSVFQEEQYKPPSVAETSEIGTKSVEDVARILVKDNAARARLKNVKLTTQGEKILIDSYQKLKEKGIATTSASFDELKEGMEELLEEAPPSPSSSPPSAALPTPAAKQPDPEQTETAPAQVTNALVLRIKELEQAAMKPSRTLREEYAEMTMTSRKKKGGKARTLNGMMDRMPKECDGPGYCKSVLCDHVFARP